MAILEPVTRAFSQWNKEVLRNADTRSFRACVDEEIREIENEIKE